MVKYSQLDSVLAALADPTRRHIIEGLLRRDLTVSALAKPFAISAPAITKHLRVLENADLITRKKTGRLVICRVKTQPLIAINEWLEKHRAFWQSRLIQLEKYLKK